MAALRLLQGRVFGEFDGWWVPPSEGRSSAPSPILLVHVDPVKVVGAADLFPLVLVQECIDVLVVPVVFLLVVLYVLLIVAMVTVLISTQNNLTVIL